MYILNADVLFSLPFLEKLNLILELSIIFIVNLMRSQIFSSNPFVDELPKTISQEPKAASSNQQSVFSIKRQEPSSRSSIYCLDLVRDHVLIPLAPHTHGIGALTHPNVLHSVYSTLRALLGKARLTKLRLGGPKGTTGQTGSLAVRAPQEPHRGLKGKICKIIYIYIFFFNQ